MDKFDRPRQRLFLQGLYDAYPEELTNEQLEELLSSFPDKKLLQQTFCIWKSMGLYLADYKKALLDITW